MNKTMQNIMKPIPVYTNSRYELRQAQENRVMEYLDGVKQSVTARDVFINCHDIPTRSAWYTIDTRLCSKILQRLEQKGRVVSVLYCGSRYYSIPVNGGEQ